jgi:quercetin dioxygenase-like cupin family protein
MTTHSEGPHPASSAAPEHDVAGPFALQLLRLSEVTSAPGRGIVPNVSAHSGASPLLYRLDEQPVEQISPLIGRQYLNSLRATFCKWTMKKGATVALHHHAYEQITWFVTGAADVYSQGQKFSMNAGDVLIIPPNTPHEFIFTEDTIDIDIFSPHRQDWIDGTADLHRYA